MADLGGSFTWYGHSCVELRTPGGKTLIFDPWFGNPTSPRSVDDVTTCDVMLVSHGHFDHLGSAPREVESSDALKIARATKPTSTMSSREAGSSGRHSNSRDSVAHQRMFLAKSASGRPPLRTMVGRRIKSGRPLARSINSATALEWV